MSGLGMSGLADGRLGGRILNIVARVLVTFVFWSAGLAGVLNFSGWTAEMAHFGLEPAPAYAAATAVWLLVGSALVILDRAAWLGAAALAVFTLLTIPIAHPFWTMAEPARTEHFHVVMEHISLIGAMLVVALLCRAGRRAP